MSDNEQTTAAPHTPIRPVRSADAPAPPPTSVPPSTGGTPNLGTTLPGVPTPARTTGAINPLTGTTEEQLRAQLLMASAQITALRSQISSVNTASINPSAHQSREYWLVPIDKSIKYPGEDSHTAAKTAYKQRLRAFLCKSPPIRDLITGKLPCPIATITDVIPLLKTSFGPTWEFKPKHIKRALSVLKHLDTTVYQNVVDAMDANSETRAGSWNQRNTAIYSVVCDTLDLTKKGSDLNILEVVDDNNGLALYNLILFRLQEIKSTDPLARAIQLKMNLQHIRYIPMPHGVAKYFADIESHRTDLASLARPKIIQDWEVVTKALQDLPPLHAKFKEVADLLSLQRKLFKQETTLPQCREAFLNADNENDIHGDLSNNKPRAKKRKLRTNLQRAEKRPRQSNDERTGKYKKGDCGHHPNSVSHCTQTCMNPFGVRSIFGRAKSYAEKCQAVKTSVALGWSPRAKHVTIPEGFGSDEKSVPTLATDANHEPTASAVKVNQALTTNSISPNSMRTYHRVQALMTATQVQMPPSPAYMQPMFPTQRQPAAFYPATQHLAPPIINGPAPLQTYHVAPRYVTPTRQTIPTNLMGLPPRAPMPQMLQPYQQPRPQPQLQQPSEDDLIAAGMRYYATQAGNQDFR